MVLSFEYFEAAEYILGAQTLCTHRHTHAIHTGVVAADPARLDFSELEEVVDLRDRMPVWMLSGQDLQHCEDEEEDEDEDVAYGLHLDLLTPGNRVGVMVNNAGELHYYLNGNDQGCAFTNIPEGKGDRCFIFIKICCSKICTVNTFAIFVF